ncbi:MAG: hypothetical protein J5J06_05215 [Phycisphaerae bacterium]|nr:hypothetical protein [Phycisphaerae bacterium]
MTPFGESMKTVSLGICVAALAAAGSGCGLGTPADDAAKAYSRVFLMGTDLLEPPIYGHDKVYKAANQFAISGDSARKLDGVGFFVLLAMVDSDALRVRLVDRDTGVIGVLRRVQPPQSTTEKGLAETARPFNDAVRERLQNEIGVFWVGESAPGDAPGSQRVGVLLPTDVLTAFSRLEFFTSETAGGTALGAAEVQLARDFYYMAVIGDSIQWGNGLHESDKISSRVAATIERRTGRRAIIQRYAQSGAPILPTAADGVCEYNCVGEVPKVETSITLQVELIEQPERVDLVLMDGCIVDVGDAILDTEIAEDELVAQTAKYCDGAFGTLLSEVTQRVPQAEIVATGYYQIVGPQSDLFGIQQWADSQGQPVDGKEEILAKLVHNSTVFAENANLGIQTAIDRVNAMLAMPRVAFADPEFGEENAVFSPNSLLWGLTGKTDIFGDIELDLLLFPEDPLQNLRAEACFDPGALGDLVACLYASVAHPNPQGAERYAAAVIRELERVGVLPPSDDAGSGVDRWTTYP